MCSKACNKKLYNELLVTVCAENAGLFRSLRKTLQKRDSDDDRGSIIKLNNYQTARINRITSLVERIEELKQKTNYGVPITGKSLLSALREIKNRTGSIIWLNIDENKILCLCRTPNNVNNILRDKVWNRNVSHVLTSGTMSDGTDFGYFKMQNGLDRIA